MIGPVLERARLRVQSFRSGHSWLLWWLVAGFFAVGLLPLNVALAAEQFDVWPLAAFVAGIAQSTALVLLLVRPKAATALQFLASSCWRWPYRPTRGRRGRSRSPGCSR